jgi:hypothetical protein
LTFAYLPEGAVRFSAIVIFVLFIATVVAVLYIARIETAVKQRGQRLRKVICAFLLDTQTNSFSLSKFQLFLWIGASVFAYIYFYVCRTFVQRLVEFPPLPDPKLLFLTAGTAVFATGVTSAVGPKGAGAEGPSVADFFTDGDLVAGERLQFLLWTVTGVLGFIGLVLARDPAGFVKLPDMPDGFLPLMGLSAAGYLGGKIVRSSGPVISNLAVTKFDDANHTLTMRIVGDSISSKATVQVDDNVWRADLILITPIKKDDPTSDLCSEVEIVFKEAGKLAKNTHSVKLVNSDGRSASRTFPVAPMSITKVQELNGGTTPKPVDVEGENFDNAVTATWTPFGGQATQATVTFVNANKLQVSVVPGTGEGKGQLVLSSGIGLQAACEIKVRAV